MKKLVTTAAVVAVLALSACGSSGGDSKPALTKSEFVKQANAICKTGKAKLAAVQKANDPGDSVDAQVKFVTEHTLPSIQAQLSDIRDLGFPKGDEDTVDGIITEAEKALDTIEKDPKAALASGQDPFADVNPKLKAYGLTECGSA